jgi:hypothetical protein
MLEHPQRHHQQKATGWSMGSGIHAIRLRHKAAKSLWAKDGEIRAARSHANDSSV